MKKLLITLAVLASFGQSSMAANATTDFSITNGNPNGAWSYGYSTTLGGSFVAYAIPTASVPHAPQTGSIEAWTTSANPNDVPWVGKAGSSGWTCCGSVVVAPNTLTLHPGPAGEFSIVRYTAPSAGSYQVSGSFWGQDNGGGVGTTTDVHVRTTADAFTSSVVGFGNAQNFSTVLALSAGQSVDFIVGVGSTIGPNFNYWNDSTGLTATVTAVPEPAGVMLAMAGMALAVGAGRLRRQA